MKIGQTVQSLRKTRGLTQQQLCDKIGLSYSTLAKIERGAISEPSFRAISKIAQTLDVSLAYFDYYMNTAED